MFIEDLICKLHLKCKVNRYDESLVNSFVNQIFSGIGFTEKQSVLAVRILKRYSANLNLSLNVDILPFLENPSYKFTIRKINQSKRVSVVDSSIWERAIKIEFPYNQEKVEHIRKNKENLNFSTWDAEHKAWMFSVDERHIQFLSNFIKNDVYEIDEEFQNYLNQVETIVNSMENYVPMLTIENDMPKYKNVSHFVPEMTSKDIISALFEARKAGIFTWDEKVDQYLDTAELDSITKKFLTNDTSKPLAIDSENYPIQCLKDVVKYASPVLFIIPGGSETVKTKMVYNFLTQQGYTNDEMSVMFRLPSNDGREFNEFVKNCGLNNPITEKTRFVFVSIKLPKPVLKSKMRFNTVISLGRSNVHYTIREFFKNSHNLIFYCEPNKQKEFNFGDL